MVRKSIGAHDRISSDPAISEHEVAMGVCRQSLLELDTLAKSMREGIKMIFVLAG
jgi:hypothetical protein